MSDDSVHAALRSDAPLVVVEAPAGCGKTTKGADYAREIADAGATNRLLILTHTHAACSVFADRIRGVGSRVEIRTIDSVITHIASAYHAGLGLPTDIAAWVRQHQDGYAELAMSVAALLERYPMIVRVARAAPPRGHLRRASGFERRTALHRYGSAGPWSKAADIRRSHAENI